MRAKDLEVLNEMPFFFWVKDDEGKYIWVNRALNEMAGQDITGKTDYELPWANDAEKLRADDMKVLLTGEHMFVEEYIQQPGKASLNVCKFVGDYEGKRCAIGVSFVIK
jgi:PAS domain-containing protein